MTSRWMVCALALLIGCSETSGTGGGGGACQPQTGCPEDADLCTHDACIDGACIYLPVDCDDHNDCTSDACEPDQGCTTASVADGTVCAGGTCQDGTCALSGTELPCSEQGIRNAIAAGGGPYTFDCGGPTTVVTEAEIVIDNDVILDGEGSLTVDAQRMHRVYSVATDITAELRGFTISRGNATHGGGIENKGVLTLTNSTVSENEASDGDGGGILNEGMLTLANSTVSGNATSDGGAGIFNAATMTMTRSTVSGNRADLGGHHEDGYGGGIVNVGTMTLTNSTVSTNEAFWGAGIYNTGTAALSNCTVSENWVRFLGYPVILADRGMLTLTNSLIDDDCYRNVATITSNGYNIESELDTCGLDQPTDQVNVSADDLKLEELANNGGPTETVALGNGSVAIDVIPEADCAVETDQRGEPRPGGTTCDVGAFEVQP